jgi:hypothetical protein
MASEISEHERYVVLEVKQNIDAVDPASILEWGKFDGGELTEDERYWRLGEALYLAATRLEEVSSSERELHTLLEKTKQDLSFEMDTIRISKRIFQQARENVHKTWTHSS